MSIASVTRTIKFIQKQGMYVATIMSPMGDLFQNYAEQSANTAVSPNFEAPGNPYYQPQLNMIITSSRAEETLVTPFGVRYYVGGTEITFNSSGVSTNFSGAFQKVNPNPSAGQLYYGLKILKNLAALNNFASMVIKMVATLNNAVQSDEIQASYTIPISQSTGSRARVTIAAGDNNNFLISEKDGSCKLKAITFSGNDEVVTTGLAYEWAQLVSEGANVKWQVIGGQTGDTITVNEADIQTSAQFRVKVNFNGEDLYDYQEVLDSSDDYDIEANPNPVDEAIEAGKNEKIVYTPKLVKRRGGAAVKQPAFTYYVRDAAGADIVPSSTGASITITLGMCEQADGDLSLTIFANDLTS